MSTNMKKLIAENLNEFLSIEEVKPEEKLDEGLFTSLKQDIDKFLQSPKDEKLANALLSKAFAKQFSQYPKVKEKILSLSFEDKVKVLQQCSKKLEDKTIGILKLVKNAEGKIIVGGFRVQGVNPGQQGIGQTPTK